MKKAYETIPAGKHECPVCNGAGRMAADERMKKYRTVIAGYDLTNDTVKCCNCGGQYMFGSPKGYVGPNKEGVGCNHSYKSETVGRCLTRYTCECGDSYTIDSGD